MLVAERERIKNGKVPLFLVSQFTSGLDSQLRSFGRSGPLAFALPVAGVRPSLVLLEASADSLRLVVNASPGRILAARICTFAEARCGGFEASAARGFLHARISNAGTLPAAFTLTVSNCRCVGANATVTAVHCSQRLMHTLQSLNIRHHLVVDIRPPPAMQRECAACACAACRTCSWTEWHHPAIRGLCGR